MAAERAELAKGVVNFVGGSLSINERIQQPNARRACLGELIQIDACEHRWFEDRAPIGSATAGVSQPRHCSPRVVTVGAARSRVARRRDDLQTLAQQLTVP